MAGFGGISHQRGMLLALLSAGILICNCNSSLGVNGNATIIAETLQRIGKTKGSGSALMQIQGRGSEEDAACRLFRTNDAEFWRQCQLEFQAQGSELTPNIRTGVEKVMEECCTPTLFTFTCTWDEVSDKFEKYSNSDTEHSDTEHTDGHGDEAPAGKYRDNGSVNPALRFGLLLIGIFCVLFWRFKQKSTNSVWNLALFLFKFKNWNAFGIFRKQASTFCPSNNPLARRSVFPPSIMRQNYFNTNDKARELDRKFKNHKREWWIGKII